jgi:DNA methylase
MSLRDYLFHEEPGITLYCGDCREILPLLMAPCTSYCIEECDGRCVRPDHVVTDPPYGFRKAAWDDTFPMDWLPLAAAVARQSLVVMPGINNLLRLPLVLPPFEYRWTLAVHLTNGMTRGLMGFGNWIPAVVYARPEDSLYKPQQDCADVPVIGDMPDHPSPKPERAMTWIIDRLPDGSILDPFAGSGTTLWAAKNLNRRAIGIEIEPKYCEIAVKRLRQEVLPFAETLA